MKTSYDEIDISLLPGDIQPILAQFDVDNNGKVDASELARAAELYKRSLKQASNLKKIITGLIFGYILMSITMAALVFVMINVTKDTKIDESGHMLDKSGLQLIIQSKSFELSGGALQSDGETTYACVPIKDLAIIWDRKMDGSPITMTFTNEKGDNVSIMDISSGSSNVNEEGINLGGTAFVFNDLRCSDMSSNNERHLNEFNSHVTYLKNLRRLGRFGNYAGYGGSGESAFMLL